MKFSTHLTNRAEPSPGLRLHTQPHPPGIMKRITRKQFDIVSFIRDFINQNGFSPTLYEIADHFSISATTAAAHIAALERKHAVERRKGTRRSIRPTGMDRGKKARSSVSIPLYAKLSCFPDEPDSRCCVDPGLIPDDAAARDLFAFRSGVFGEQLPGVDPGDVLVVWTRPGVLHPGMLILNRPGSEPVCRTVNSSRTPEPDTIGRVVAVLRSL